MRLEHGDQAEAAIETLAELATDEPSADDGLVRIPVRERRGAIAEAVRRLDAEGIGIDDIAVRRPTLDDVFLTLTGRAPEPEEREEPRPTPASTRRSCVR